DVPARFRASGGVPGNFLGDADLASKRRRRVRGDGRQLRFRGVSMARFKIRRSQAVVPFGVGAIVDFENEALMTAGLDAWPREPTFALYDSRLAARLDVDHFRQPPVSEGTTVAKLPFVRFPYWHFCPQ